MRRKIAMLAAVLLFTNAVACTSAAGSSSSGAVRREEVSSSGKTASAESTAPFDKHMFDEAFLNRELMAMVHGYNFQLKQWRDEECCAYNVGSVTDALEYYDPYINVYFLSTTSLKEEVEPYENPDSGFDPNHPRYPLNPYPDDYRITGLWMQADFDSPSQKITNQESLQQFFLTDGLITYGLLAEKLRQAPALVHDPEAGYLLIKKYDPFSELVMEPIQGGVYDAVYYIENLIIEVGFIEFDGGYTALRARVSDEDPASIF